MAQDGNLPIYHPYHPGHEAAGCPKPPGFNLAAVIPGRNPAAVTPRQDPPVVRGASNNTSSDSEEVEDPDHESWPHKRMGHLLYSKCRDPRLSVELGSTAAYKTKLTSHKYPSTCTGGMVHAQA